MENDRSSHRSSSVFVKISVAVLHNSTRDDCERLGDLTVATSDKVPADEESHQAAGSSLSSGQLRTHNPELRTSQVTQNLTIPLTLTF
jgi:hypothetical protein